MGGSQDAGGGAAAACGPALPAAARTEPAAHRRRAAPRWMHPPLSASARPLAGPASKGRGLTVGGAVVHVDADALADPQARGVAHRDDRRPRGHGAVDQRQQRAAVVAALLAAAVEVARRGVGAGACTSAAGLGSFGRARGAAIPRPQLPPAAGAHPSLHRHASPPGKPSSQLMSHPSIHPSSLQGSHRLSPRASQPARRSSQEVDEPPACVPLRRPCGAPVERWMR